jgi:AcrR family transcriptional regulator
MSVASGSSVEARDDVDDGTASDAPVASRSHTRHGEQRKQQLLDAAAALFAQHGYSATRIADICREAGVAKGLFYWYFPTKAELFTELVRVMRRRLRRSQAEAMDEDASALDRIVAGTEASVRFMAANAAYFALLEVERTDPEFADVFSEGSGVYLSDVRRLVVSGQVDGTIADGDPHLLSIGVLGAVSAFSNSYRSGTLDPDVTVEVLAHFVGQWVRHALT